MSKIDEIMTQADDFALSAISAAEARIGQRRTADAHRDEERAVLLELIAAALAEARREGAEQMRDAAAKLTHKEPLYYSSGEPAEEELAQAIEDLPMPDGERQAVLLTDEQIERAYWEALGVEYLPPTDEDADKEAYSALMRVGGAIQALVLAANNLDVRRG